MKIGVQEQKRVGDCMDNIWNYQGISVKVREKRMKKKLTGTAIQATRITVPVSSTELLQDTIHLLSFGF